MGRMTMGRMAMGRMTMGRMAMCRMAMGRMTMGRMSIGHVTIGHVTIGHVTIGRIKSCCVAAARSNRDCYLGVMWPAGATEAAEAEPAVSVHVMTLPSYGRCSATLSRVEFSTYFRGFIRIHSPRASHHLCQRIHSPR